MSSSSRSIAAARQRRSGEVVQKPQAPPQNFKQNIGQKPQQQQQQGINKMQGQVQAPGQMQRPKLSIGDAIGLVTLRLGRVEEFMIRAQNPQGGLNLGGGSGSTIPENSQLIDKSVFTNMISRLDSLEKKDSNKQMAALESELRSTKDLLITLMSKFEKFSKETDDKFTDFDCAISEIEGKMDFKVETETEQIDSSETSAGVEGITFEISESN
jgi:hypothetical protein